jgi:polysaccharide biosynthesis transport protein
MANNQIPDPNNVPQSEAGAENNQYPRSVQQEEAFDYMRFIQILIIHKWKFLIVFVLVFVGAVFYAWKQPTVFISKYEVFYNETINKFALESNVPVLKSDFDENYWLSTMRSNELAQLTLENSGLPYTTAIIRRMIHVDMKSVKGKTLPIFEVSVVSRRNDLIPILIKAFVKSLNDMLLRNQAQNSEQLVNFLSDQIQENNRKLSDIDRHIMMEQATNPAALRDLRKVSADLESFRGDMLNTQITLASTRAARYRTEEELLNLDGTIINESAYTEPLKVQLMNLQVDLARSLTKMQEDHPTVKGIRDNIVQIQNMIKDSITERLQITGFRENPLKSQLMSKHMELQITEISLETRMNSLQNVIAEFERQLLPDVADDNQFQLMRNRELIIMTINQLNSKHIEAQSAANVSLSRFLLIDEPTIPTSPSSKNKRFYILMGIVAALLIAGATVFVLDMLDNRLMVVSDYERFFSIPMMGALLHKSAAEQEMTVVHDREDIYRRMNEFGEIMVNLRHITKGTDKKLFAVCSPVRGEGKSLVSHQFASALADKGNNVLLVDMDFIVPRLTKKMEQTEQKGLGDLLVGTSEIEDILLPTDNPKLTFTGIGVTDDVGGSFYEHPGFNVFIDKVRERFDVVIFDTPATLYIPDTISFMERMDGIISVVRLRYTTRNSLDRLFKLLGPVRSKIVGTILNDLKMNFVNRYTDYYNYSYSYGYDDKGKKKKARTKQDRKYPYKSRPVI